MEDYWHRADLYSTIRRDKKESKKGGRECTDVYVQTLKFPICSVIFSCSSKKVDLPFTLYKNMIKERNETENNRYRR